MMTRQWSHVRGNYPERIQSAQRQRRPKGLTSDERAEVLLETELLIENDSYASLAKQQRMNDVAVTPYRVAVPSGWSVVWPRLQKELGPPGAFELWLCMS